MITTENARNNSDANCSALYKIHAHAWLETILHMYMILCLHIYIYAVII